MFPHVPAKAIFLIFFLPVSFFVTMQFRYGVPMFLKCHLRAHYVPQFLQVLQGEVPVVPIAALHVLVDAVDVESKRLEQLRLKPKRALEALRCARNLRARAEARREPLGKSSIGLHQLGETGQAEVTATQGLVEAWQAWGGAGPRRANSPSKHPPGLRRATRSWSGYPAGSSPPVCWRCPPASPFLRDREETGRRRLFK